MIDLLRSFSENTKVWIYQSPRAFTQEELIWLEREQSCFVQEWNNHGKPLSAQIYNLYRRFIVVAVDQNEVPNSGCSIDKLTQFIKRCEQKLEIQLMDRMLVYYLKNNEWIPTHYQKLRELVKSGELEPTTPVINPLVASKAQFEKEFQAPLAQSWLKAVIQ